VHSIEPGYKVLILGMNGSGKSVLAQSLARGWALGPLVVIDPKGNDPAAIIANATICYTAEDVVRHLPGRIVYRPSMADKTVFRPGDDRRLRPLWCRVETIATRLWALARATGRPSMVVVHELRELCTEQSIGPMFRELITAGRGYGITLVLLTQRPQRVALEARSEAQVVICFTLTDPAARAEAAALLADPSQPELVALIRSQSLPLDFTWWYRGPDFRLSLHYPIGRGSAT
jgi:hypothetical protein